MVVIHHADRVLWIRVLQHLLGALHLIERLLCGLLLRLSIATLRLTLEILRCLLHGLGDVRHLAVIILAG